jgi:ArsR family transcriptional regulator
MDQLTCCNIDEFAKALGQDTRQKILRLLQNNEMNVGELSHHLNLTQPTISYHLAILRRTKLVISRRYGQYTLHRANQECVIQCCQNILDQFKVSFEIQDRS